MNFLSYTLAAAEGGAGKGPDPVGHIIAHPFWSINGWWVWSSAIGNLVLAGLIMLVLAPLVAKHIATGAEAEGDDRYLTRNRFAELIEIMCIGIRDGVIRPLLGARTDKFAPFLLVLFFFILISNLLGLIPLLDFVTTTQYYFVKLTASGTPAEIEAAMKATWKETHRAPVGGTATQSIWVTGALAFVAFAVVNASGIKELGVVEYFKHLTAGTPWPLWPIMVPVELLGIIIKPVALALRLFANMTAGHILMAVLYLFIELGWGQIAETQSWLIGGAAFTFIGILSGAAAIGIYLLETFIAFLQAFIFMFLTAVFIALYEDHSHHGEHTHGDYAHGDQSAPGAHRAIEPALKPVAA